MKMFFIITTSLVITLLAAQDDIIWPLDCNHQLTSSFAEYRVGHFHAGIDLRTPNGEGMPIIAIGDGSIIRARETPWGYGKAVYFRLTDGNIAVFAHLSDFSEPLASRIEEEKYKTKLNTVELWFKDNEMPLSKGDTLGFSGSSGAGSPHLHFEIRDGMEKPVNPMFFGYTPIDTMKPTIDAIWIKPREDNGSVEGEYRPLRFAVTGNDGSLRLRRETPVFVKGLFSISAEFYDRESGVNYNRYGIYDIQLFIDGNRFYHFHSDTFAFTRTKQIGLIYDLTLQEEMGLKRPPMKLEHPFGADIGLLRGTHEGSGIIRAEDTLTVVLKIEDFHENKSELEFTVIASAAETPSLDTTAIDMDSARVFSCSLWCNVLSEEVLLVSAMINGNLSENVLLQRDRKFIYPERVSDSLYVFRVYNPEKDELFQLFSGDTVIPLDPGLIEIESDAECSIANNLWGLRIPKKGVFVPFLANGAVFPSNSTIGEYLKLEPPGVILRRNARLFFNGEVSDDDTHGLCLVRLWNDDTFFVANSVNDNGQLNGTISSFGMFAVARDTLPPEISLSISDSSIVADNIHIKISDDLSGFSNEILPESFIDGDWHPNEYDPEKGDIVIDVSDLEKGKHKLVIKASDVCGNSVSDSVLINKN